MQNFTLITSLVLGTFGCKWQLVSERHTFSRADKGLLAITDTQNTIRKAVAKFKVKGNVDELAALIKGGKHDPRRFRGSDCRVQENHQGSIWCR